MKDRAQPEQAHIGDEELVLLANGELSEGRAAEVAVHIEGCGSCRTQLDEIHETIREFAQLRRTELDPKLPPIHVARAELRRRLAEASQQERSWIESAALEPSRLHLALGLAALLLVAAIVTLSSLRQTATLSAGSDAVHRSAPNPQFTPGLATALSREEVCSINAEREPASVPRAMALEVFRCYGVADPEPGAYEIDYVIPPALGGRRDVRNLWPQPYDIQPWNAHAKDALEDYLLRSVCDGTVDVRTAQRELADGWIAAYQTRFRTAEPLVEHAGFLRDEPWR